MAEVELRNVDKWGSGAFGASRVGRTHKGVDIVSTPGQSVESFTYGTVTKLGWCYSQPNRSHLRYVEVSLDGNRFRYFYCAPLVHVGDTVSPGDKLGTLLSLGPIFPGITEHYHFEIINPAGDYVDPASMIPAIEEATL